MSYFGVRAILERGRRLSISVEDEKTYEMAMTMIGKEDRLVGIVDNGLWAIAPDLTRESDYTAFLTAYNKGAYLNMMLYGLAKDEVEKCPNEGRVNLSELENHPK
jgi:hypothetical protein